LTAPTVEMVAAMIEQQWLIEKVMQRVEWLLASKCRVLAFEVRSEGLIATGNRGLWGLVFEFLTATQSRLDCFHVALGQLFLAWVPLEGLAIWVWGALYHKSFRN
jgi:hypothetical protein